MTRAWSGGDAASAPNELLHPATAAHLGRVHVAVRVYGDIVQEDELSCIAADATELADLLQRLTIEEVDASDEDYFRWNLRILRNVGVVNFLDGCAVTLPCQGTGAAPVGLSVCGPALSDRHILAVARAVEGVLADRA